MLIQSPRHRVRDLEAWEKIARYDTYPDPGMPRRIATAIDTIRLFAEAGPCFVSTSWGKDSTVVAWLAAQTGLHLPLVRVRVDGFDNPDSDPTRDAFLNQYGHMVDYHEITVPGDNVARWWHEDTTGMIQHAPDPGFREAERRFGGRRITGIRAEESRMRGMVMQRWGKTSPKTCRPIGYWSAVEVFRLLGQRDLPIHPAYAMNYGGRLDRRWIRVSTIGGIRGADKERADWETTYYPDIVLKGKTNEH